MAKRKYKYHEPELIFKEIKESNLTVQTTQKEISPIFGYYINCLDFTSNPITNEFLKDFAIGLTNWAADNDEALTIHGFYLEKGLCPETYKKLVATYPIIGMAHEFAMMAIGDRRERGALTYKYDAKFVMYSMPMYDEEWKKLEEWKANLKHETFEKKEVSSIVIKKM